MALSELVDQLTSKGVKISLKPNYKKYYNKFPHVIRFLSKSNNYIDSRSLNATVYSELRNKVNSDEYSTRCEYYSLNIYCNNPKDVIKSLKINTLKSWANIEIEEMDEKVLGETSIRPELPRAQTVVVKKLPRNQYRYRVHWPTSHQIFAKIGGESISAIADQIKNDPNSRIDYGTVERLKRGNFWGTPYFYTNSEDLFCIISLINPLFIKKIEKFTTLEELNEKTISGSTN